jgi:KaiC/GvpD/RAD55 family RecA-like ATPase
MQHFYTTLADQYFQDEDSGWTNCKTTYDGKPPKTRHQSILYMAIWEHERSTPSKKIEEVCQEINWLNNEPPLPEREVVRLVNQVLKAANSGVLNLEDGQLRFLETSPARLFLFGKDVIPMGTVSVIGGLGGSGKSMAMVEMIVAAVTSSKYANRSSINQTCSLYLAFEDSQEELNARFSAVMANYSVDHRNLVMKNAKAISLVGKSMPLVTMKGRNPVSTGFSELLIEKVLELKDLTNTEQALLIIDHARLAAIIDWNDAAQVTVLTQELHRIAHEANTAVVLIAHSPKNTASPDHEISQADIAGSSALVDNARYVGLVRGMSPKEAKDLGIKAEIRNNYLKLECVKSNYSKTGLIGWFIKTSCPNHHVATHTYVEPCKTIPTKEGDSADESRIIKYIRQNPDLTLTDLRKRSGKNSVLGLSDLKIRDIVNTLLEKGLLAHIPPTANYTKKTTPQFKGVLGATTHV